MDSQARQVVRGAKAAAGLTLGAAGWLTVAPVVQAVCLRQLRARHPEYFKPAAALAAVLAVIDQDTTQEISP